MIVYYTMYWVYWVHIILLVLYYNFDWLIDWLVFNAHWSSVSVISSFFLKEILNLTSTAWGLGGEWTQLLWVHTGARCVRKKKNTILILYNIYIFFSDAPSPCVGTWGRVSSSCSTSGTREVSNFSSRYAGCMEFTKYTSCRLSLTLCV